MSERNDACSRQRRREMEGRRKKDEGTSERAAEGTRYLEQMEELLQ